MNRRGFLLALAPTLAAGACSHPPYRTALLDREWTSGYPLASGDKLRIIVFGQDNLSNIYAVDGSGRIAMPLIGIVPLAGLTTQQAERAIEGRLRDGFIREPKVTVEIDTYRPFFILGEVVNSGQFAFVSGMSVQTAVAIAGGFGPRAARDYAEVTRPSPGGLVGGIVPMTYPLRPGDTVVVKERFF